ncbi:MAG TPA: 16S rRNA (cytidine(1402)-2'-O)-methyltransferase [Proteobacteria bacterium]|nr:16S rRNA (cytidine(1402)-2'-O)-methyltransferase [Pseudomonadota bacterium]
MTGAGELFLIATPIGNLADITLRALETLRACDLIAAEDTRTAKKLFQRYQIQARLLSLHDNSTPQRLAEILLQLQNGARIGLISEAGTPGISDPGYRLLQLVLDAGIRVTPLPGACAAISALCASGLPSDAFYFAGFLPVKPGLVRRRLEALKNIEATLIFYESPRRLNATLQLMAAVLGNRSACVARELTKLYEEFLRLSLTELLAWGEKQEWRGEITLLVAGCDLKEYSRDPQRLLEEELRLKNRLADQVFTNGCSGRDLVGVLESEFPLLKRRRIYELVNCYAHSE